MIFVDLSLAATIALGMLGYNSWAMRAALVLLIAIYTCAVSHGVSEDKNIT